MVRSLSGSIKINFMYAKLSFNNKTHVFHTNVDEASHGYVIIFPSAKTMN
jgi:hypothetical protein